jgi:disulfide bond formation protein DsbB
MSTPESGAGDTKWCNSILTWLAFPMALATLGGSLWLSLGMNLKACPLCYYQRTFIMGVVGVLMIGLLSRARRGASLSALALPVATGGLGVALYHVYLELTGALECPLGIEGYGTAPQQSLAAFAALFIVLSLDAIRRRAAGGMTTVGGILLGALFAVGAVLSTAPLPPPPPEAYQKPIDMCRKPAPKNGEGETK